MGIISDISSKLTSISDTFYKRSVEEIQKVNKVSDAEIKKFEEVKYKDINTYDSAEPRKPAQTSVHNIGLEIIFSDKSGSKVDLTPYIHSILVVKLFEDCFKPIYKINLELPIPQILTIEGAKEYKYKLSIKTAPYEEGQLDPSLQMSSESSNLKMESALECYLLPYVTPPSIKTPDLEKKLKEGDTNIKEAKLFYSVECFNLLHVKSSHSILSTTYRNATPLEIIHAMYASSQKTCFKGMKGLVWKNTDMREIVESFTIPPMCFYDAIMFMQKTLNIYNRKPMIFLEDDTIYAIKRGYFPDFPEGYNPRVIIIIGERNEFGDGTRVKDILATIKGKSDDIVYMSENKPNIVDTTHITTTEVGSKTIIKTDSTLEGVNSMCLGFKDNTSTNATLKFQDGNNLLHSAYDGKEVYVEENGTGRYYMELKIDEIQANSLKITILLKNVNIGHFKITTPVLLKFVEQDMRKYDGLYYIRTATGFYSKESINDAFMLNVRIELGRKYNDDGKVAK